VTSVRKLRRARTEELSKKQDVPVTIPGLMGRASDEVIKVTTRPGYIYVRIGNDETLAQAYWTGTVAYDRACICGYDDATQKFRVLRLRQDEYTTAGFTPVPEIDEHGATHLYPDPSDKTTAHRGTDVAFVSERQLLELRLGKHTSGNFTVRIERSLVEVGGGIRWIVTQTLDLTNSVPASGARWVTVYLLPDGTISQSDGTVQAKSQLSVSDIPVPTFSHFRLGAVMLWQGQGQIRDDGGRRDIEDLRLSHLWGTATTSTDTTEQAMTPRWFSDGPLAVADEVGGVWRLMQAFQVESVSIYLTDTGSAGATTVDVDKSIDDGVTWTTLFPAQGNRPSIAGGASSHVATGTPAATSVLPKGTLLRMNIEAVGTDARGLSVQLDGEEGVVLTSGILYAIMGAGR